MLTRMDSAISRLSEATTGEDTIATIIQLFSTPDVRYPPKVMNPMILIATEFMEIFQQEQLIKNITVDPLILSVHGS